MESKRIHDLPEEVFEFILSFLSPYSDLKNCMLVSKRWRKYVRDVVRRMRHDFARAISEMQIEWFHMTPEPGPTITKRYSHSACCHGTSMYVFGGCTSTSTTFNDLWRLDLAERRWIRPLAMGTYPSPKACATMVCHNDNLILFGGWTHPSPYPLHQAWRLFSQLHIYNPEDNRWTQIISSVTPPAMAGHSATVHGDNMVVFGGLQKQLNGRPYASSNDIWILNLSNKNWKKQETTSLSPRPRYGQSQLALDEYHALIVGGCGGPNMLFNDMWLLTMSSDSNSLWTWTEIEVRNVENSAPHLWCHPGCKVGDKMVVLSRGYHSKVAAATFGGQLLRPTATRTWVPPHESDAGPSNFNQPERLSNNASNVIEGCVNGRKGTFHKPTPVVPENAQSVVNKCNSSLRLELESDSTRFASTSEFPMPCSSEGASGSSKNYLSGALPSTSSYISCNASSSGDFVTLSETSSTHTMSPVSCGVNLDSSTAHISTSPSELSEQSKIFHNTPLPSIRPNPMRNRQRQLEGLRRMEERIRTLSQKGQISLPRHVPEANACSQSRSSTLQNNSPRLSPISTRHIARNPMCMYVADLKCLLTHGYVSWLPIQHQVTSQGPEDTILYSLVEGRGELIMFGGIHKDLGTSSTSQTTTSGINVPEIVSNTVHFITAQKWVI